MKILKSLLYIVFTIGFVYGALAWAIACLFDAQSKLFPLNAEDAACVTILSFVVLCVLTFYDALKLLVATTKLTANGGFDSE